MHLAAQARRLQMHLKSQLKICVFLYLKMHTETKQYVLKGFLEENFGIGPLLSPYNLDSAFSCVFHCGGSWSEINQKLNKGVLRLEVT